MSDDHQSVSLDMLETRLREAESELVSAIRRRATAAEHMRLALRGSGDPIAMGILTGIERLLRQSRVSNQNELLLRWNVEFQVDLLTAGLKKVVVSGSEPLRIWDHARSLFGHHVLMSYDKDQRETITQCSDNPGTVAVLGWMTSAGSGQWWPILNETRFHDLRIIGGWPTFDEETPYAAIVAKGPVSDHYGGRTLMLAHDDQHRVQRIFSSLDLSVTEISRARSLVLIELPTTIHESDSRITAARNNGLDGLRIVGALPGRRPIQLVAANS